MPQKSQSDHLHCVVCYISVVLGCSENKLDVLSFIPLNQRRRIQNSSSGITMKANRNKTLRCNLDTFYSYLQAPTRVCRPRDRQIFGIEITGP